MGSFNKLRISDDRLLRTKTSRVHTTSHLRGRMDVAAEKIASPCRTNPGEVLREWAHFGTCKPGRKTKRIANQSMPRNREWDIVQQTALNEAVRSGPGTPLGPCSVDWEPKDPNPDPLLRLMGMTDQLRQPSAVPQPAVENRYLVRGAHRPARGPHVSSPAEQAQIFHRSALRSSQNRTGNPT
jgi:hypothetical protein